MTTQPSVLFVDAFDSFAENIVALLRQTFNCNVTIIRISCDIQQDFKKSTSDFFKDFDAIVLGPGPGHPTNAADVGLFERVWQDASCHNIPVLGICLGFQSLCSTYGLPVTQLPLPCHGHAKKIHHFNQDIFRGVDDIVAVNYNSLGIRCSRSHASARPSRPGSSASYESRLSSLTLDSSVSVHSRTQDSNVQPPLEILAWDDEDFIMGIRHETLPFWGVQFHPESCKSNSSCHTVLGKWWQAVLYHNKNFRTHSKISVDALTLSTSTQQSKNLAQELKFAMDTLEDLTGNYTSTVRHTTISIEKPGPISEYCYRTSSTTPSTVMLESTKKGRYSIYALPDDSNFHLEYSGGNLSIFKAGTVIVTIPLRRDQILDLLEDFTVSKRAKGGLSPIPFWGGFVGFIAYEHGLALLDVDESKHWKSPSRTPDISLVWIDRSIVYDKVDHVAVVQSLRKDDQIWIQDTVTELSNCDPTPSKENYKFDRLLRSSQFHLPDHDSYISQIQRCQSELRDGNSYELCLTTEANITTQAGPDHSWLLYQNLRRHNPVPFAAYIHLNGTTILSSSPEQFLSWSRQGTIDMVPMKGTVKKSSEMTLAKATEILSSAKECAENLMIADLIRHDLYSTVGETAKVEVIKLCEVIEHETVYQLVSHIRGHAPVDVDDDKHLRQQNAIKYGHRALRKTLPPGSMTGAPKKRSCEILDQLEQRPRGVYSGVIGFMDVGGGGNWNVCIRTAFSNSSEDIDGKQTWRIGAGGAITVLSNEESEWEEMQTKLDSVLRAFRPG